MNGNINREKDNWNKERASEIERERGGDPLVPPLLKPEQYNENIDIFRKSRDKSRKMMTSKSKLSGKNAVGCVNGRRTGG